jgi:hypothetical protein
MRQLRRPTLLSMAAAVMLSAVPPCPAAGLHFSTVGSDPAPWSKLFGALGIDQAKNAAGDTASIVVVGPDEQVDVTALSVDHLVVVEGSGVAGQGLGIKPSATKLVVRQIVDMHAPQMQIIWEQPVQILRAQLPADYTVLATEKWSGAPVVAGKRYAHGGVLWVATGPGPSGMERYPYLLQTAVDLGLNLPVRTTNLWAFFDSAYRIHADVEYLAQRWRKAGVSVLHVAGWHNMEPDPAADDYLRNLIAACHRNAVLVYVWLELPHVSEAFWAAHPEWREKTAVGQDAQLDWRKLMNLQNPACHHAVETEVAKLLQRFDWDGVNLAELYFESLEGASNPARFTPMNQDVRTAFMRESGFDPQQLFAGGPPDARKLRLFLDYRANLATQMQSDWLAVLQTQRAKKPYLDLVLTHIDDRFEPGIRDALGADVARSLPLMKAARSTLLVEDPATLWGLGPERYSKLAQKYAELHPDPRELAVDINVVSRYQDVYPTKKQTGTELFQLVHEAANSFARVALYFESSIEKQDLDLLPAAATSAVVTRQSGNVMELVAGEQTAVSWRGPVELDGKLWPLQSETAVLAPAGRHRLSPGSQQPALTIPDFNGDIRSAVSSGSAVDISYVGRSRAIAVLPVDVRTVEVDGAPFWKSAGQEQPRSVLLPAGQHVVTLSRGN